tara:strand:+ start:793 stop:1260 length:468 start_codon:yes stop_codon:yes gene_type:complete
MSKEIFKKIERLLNSKKISYKLMKHKSTPTSKIAAKVRGTTEEQGAKAMVLRSKGEFFMFVLSGNKKINLKLAKAIIHKKRISFATPQEVLEVTDCEIGSVPPFGNLFKIPLFVDISLLKNQDIAFNAGLVTRSIIVSTKDYKNLMNSKLERFSE